MESATLQVQVLFSSLRKVAQLGEHLSNSNSFMFCETDSNILKEAKQGVSGSSPLFPIREAVSRPYEGAVRPSVNPNVSCNIL